MLVCSQFNTQEDLRISEGRYSGVETAHCFLAAILGILRGSLWAEAFGPPSIHTASTAVLESAEGADVRRGHRICQEVRAECRGGEEVGKK